METQDSVTLQLASVSQRLPVFRPGQFSMPYAHGIGEVPISISGDPSAMDGSLMQTIRGLGAVNRALHDAYPATVLGVRYADPATGSACLLFIGPGGGLLLGPRQGRAAASPPA